jgi:hypothetical protein
VLKQTRRICAASLSALLLIGVAGVTPMKAQAAERSVSLSATVLRDKIMGAWAAQTIGVTYGFPVEFRFNSVRVPDDHELVWYDGYLQKTFKEIPGVYDDIYMDLTFVQVFEDEGLDAPAQSFADAFANANYSLWFANQVARYNVLSGIKPPESGHWLNNPAANDIDFQIEADFAGIMAPGMVNTAIDISDRVGHIMNYGEGWYGGVFIASMYSLAFVNDDIEAIVQQALNVIPPQSGFHQIIADLITLHEGNPEDWKFAWEAIHKKWAHTDLGPQGLLSPFNIDAKINAAWVVLGLLYGDGDFGRTMEIATRAGDDADCNPSSAAGILGAIYGYKAIPEYWKQGLSEIEALDFAHTTISLNDAYDLSYKHAVELIRRAGGTVNENEVTIPMEQPRTVALEVAFENHYPKERRALSSSGPDADRTPLILNDSYRFDFEGVGFVLMGNAAREGEAHHVFNAELYVDGELVETAAWPTQHTKRRFYLFWKYQLPMGKHSVEVKLLNPTDAAKVTLESVATYGDGLDQTPSGSE